MGSLAWHWPENATKQQETSVESDAVPDEAGLGFQFFLQFEKYLFDLLAPGQWAHVWGLQGNVVAKLEERNQPVECQPAGWEMWETKSINPHFSLGLWLRPWQMVYMVGIMESPNSFDWMINVRCLSHPKSWKAIRGIIPGQCNTIWVSAGREDITSPYWQDRDGYNL